MDFLLVWSMEVVSREFFFVRVVRTYILLTILEYSFILLYNYYAASFINICIYLIILVTIHKFIKDKR